MSYNQSSDSFDFESLELYKKALFYIDFVYDVTQKFPLDELYGLTNQFKRAANSISLNIGEGYGETIPLSLRYLRITRGSIRECLGCSTIGFRRKFISESNYLESRKLLTELSKLSAGYRKYLNSRLDK